VAYFRLLNGFEKYLYMTREQVEKHGKKYSQTYKRGFGKWSEEFDSMALKTVIKLLLSKFGILSIEMQRAMIADQSEIVEADKDNIETKYIDNAEEATFEVVEKEVDPEAVNKIKSEKEAKMAFAKGDITEQQYFDLTLKFEGNGTKNA
jgi:recombination protein RecT